MLVNATEPDNLLEIHDADVATAFAIEALLLVDHYNFLDRYAAPPKKTAPKTPASSKASAKKVLAAKSATPRRVQKKAVAKKAMVKKAAKKSAGRRTGTRTASLRVAPPVSRMVAPAKKRAAKKAAATTPAKKASAATSGRSARVTQMPQSLEKAATKAGIFLYTNDQWSLRYFDPNDLHSLERKLFG